MHARRLLLILVPLLLAGLMGLALWLVMGDGDTDGGGGPAAEGPEPGRVDDPAGDGKRDAARGRAQRPGSIGGHVRLLVEKTPAPGVTVELTGPDDVTRRATTEGDGQFGFPDLPPGGPYEVRLTSGDYAPVLRPGLLVTSGERLDLGTLWLAAGVPVVVEVSTFDGRPLEGATVKAFVTGAGTATFDTPYDPAPVAVAQTDEAGIARFGGLPPGTWTLTAERAGYARRGLVSANVRADVPEERFRLALEPGYLLSGRVLDEEGRPVPGSPVLAIRRTLPNNTSTSPLALRTDADEQGRWSFAALPAADVVLWAGWPGARMGVLAAVRLPGVHDVDLVLLRGGRIEGRVTAGEQHDPAPDATVFINLSVLGAFALNFRVGTDAEGRYGLDLPMPGYIDSLSASAPGYQATSAELGDDDIVPVPRGITAVQDVQLKAGSGVGGVITGPDGPVAGASVGATNSEWWSDTTTDSGGRYQLSALPKGRYVIVVDAWGLAQPDRPQNPDDALQRGTAPERYVAEMPSDTPVEIDIELQPGPPLTGRVEGPDAEPVGDVVVTFDGNASRTALTDAGGRFTVPHVTLGRSFWMEARKPGYRPAQLSVEVPATGDLPEPVLRLRPGVVVEGTVSTADGRRLEGAYVQVTAWEDQGPTQEEWSWLEAPRLPVKADGTFSHPVDLDATAIRVRAAATGLRRTSSGRIRLSEGRDLYHVDLELSAGHTLGGRVVTLEGDPVARANVSAAPVAAVTESGDFSYPGAWGPPIVAVTDAEGRFRLTGLVDARYLLQAWAEGYLRDRRTVDLPHTGEFALEVVASRSIEGTVLDADGRPLLGARVQARNAAEGDLIETRSGHDGAFVLPGLTAGTYEITLAPAPERRQNIVRTKVSGIEAGTRDLVLRAATGLTITGRVQNGDGTPAAGASVSTQVEADYQVSAVADAQGAFELAGLAAGGFDLVVSAESISGFANRVERGVAGGASGVVIELEAAATTTGVLVGPDGEVLPDRYLSFMPLDETSTTGLQPWEVNGSVAAGGRFSISLARGVRYRVLMRWDAALMLPQETLVVGGVQDTRIVASRGESISGRVVDGAGKGVAGLSVNANANNYSRNAGTQEDGSFKVTGLVKGEEYNLGAQGGVWLNGWLSKPVRAGATDVVIRVVRGLPVSGRIVDQDGNPVGDVNVTLRLREGGSEVSTWIDASGEFEFPAVAPGVYDVLVGLGGAEPVSCGTARAGDRDVTLRCAVR